MLQFEFEYVLGVGVEIGINFDVRQMLHFLTHGFKWDPTSNQIASVHVGWSLDIGFQAGGDASWVFGYSTSRVTGVDGFGWGFSAEAGSVIGAGFDIAWPLPGDGMPNQFTIEFSAESAKVEVSAFFSHAIIVGYLDKGEYIPHLYMWSESYRIFVSDVIDMFYKQKSKILGSCLQNRLPKWLKLQASPGVITM